MNSLPLAICLINKLGLFVQTHEMQSAKCKMQNWDLSYRLRQSKASL